MNINGMNNEIYDIHNYTDKEMFELLDLVNPTDRELEAKILHYVHKYTNMGNESGDRLAQFYVDREI
jgi:NADH:ubiquinone oxidoreductase subunit E